MVSKEPHMLIGRLKWYIEKKGKYGINHISIVLPSRDIAPILKEMGWKDKDRLFIIVEDDEMHIFKNQEDMINFRKLPERLSKIEKDLMKVMKVIDEKLKKR